MLYPAISIRQPWAWAILHAGKDVENRTWNLPKKHIGKVVLLHAGLGVEPDSSFELVNLIGEVRVPDDVQIGGIVGTLVFGGENNARTAFSLWRADGQNHWAIERSWPVPFHPCKGQLGFFKVDYPHDINSAKLDG